MNILLTEDNEDKVY